MKAPVSDTAVYHDFRDAFPEMANKPGTKISSASDQRRHRSVVEKYNEIQRQGWINVTVINLHAFPLDLNMGYLGHLTVPAKKQGSLYFRLVIDQPRLDMVDNGDAKYVPNGVFPKQIAEDLIREYAETGGVFFFEGTGEVPADQLAEAKDAQLSWYWKKFAEGNSSWAQFRKDPRYVDDRMRDAAKELFRLKLINEQPEWISVSRDESPNIPCEGCGNILAKIAKFCPTCETIYDVEWVKVRRPDIYSRQMGPSLTTVAAGATGASVSDIDAMIAEESAGTAPKGRSTSTQFKPKSKNDSQPSSTQNPIAGE